MRRMSAFFAAYSRISPVVLSLWRRSPNSDEELAPFSGPRWLGGDSDCFAAVIKRSISNPGPIAVVFPSALVTKRHSNACSLLLNMYTISLLDLVRVSVPRALRIQGPFASEVQTTAARGREESCAVAPLEAINADESAATTANWTDALRCGMIICGLTSRCAARRARYTTSHRRFRRVQHYRQVRAPYTGHVCLGSLSRLRSTRIVCKIPEAARASINVRVVSRCRRRAQRRSASVAHLRACRRHRHSPNERHRGPAHCYPRIAQ